MRNESPIADIVVLGLAGVLLLGGLTGCGKSSDSGVALRQADDASSAVSSNECVTLDYEAVSAEYDEAASRLELPPGMVFPGMPGPVYAGAPGEPVGEVWGPGCGIVAAQFYWIDAWTVEWLEQRGKDPEREAKALDVLRNEVPACEVMTNSKYADQSTRDWYFRCLERAEIGDPSMFQQTIDVNNVEITREGE